jgi:hypothetical protein
MNDPIAQRRPGAPDQFDVDRVEPPSPALKDGVQLLLSGHVRHVANGEAEPPRGCAVSM